MSDYFDHHLYKEGLKKIRTPGITATVIVLVFSAILPLTRLLTTNPFDASDPEVSAVMLGTPLYPIIFLAPILTFCAFNFLNQRKACDFYHALPHRRTCLFFSHFAAVLTWLFAAILAGLLLAAVLWFVQIGFAVAFFDLLAVWVMYAAAVLLVAALTALAMTLTGTTLSNVLVFLLFAVSVRMTMYTFLQCITRQYALIVAENSSLEFLSIWNSPFLAPIKLFDNDIYSEGGLLGYYLLAGAVLTAFACMAFCKRPSQMAGRSAPNRVTQHILRILVALPLVAEAVRGALTDSGTLAFFFTRIIYILLIYYLYEIITTRRFKNWIGATAVLPILAICGLAVWGGSTAIAYQAIHYSPSADEIDSVSIVYYSDDWFWPEEHYYESDDPQVRAMIAEQLAIMEDTVQTYGAEAYLDGYHLMGEHHPYSYAIRIHSKWGITRTRRFCISGTMLEKLRQLMREDPVSKPPVETTRKPGSNSNGYDPNQPSDNTSAQKLITLPDGTILEQRLRVGDAEFSLQDKQYESYTVYNAFLSDYNRMSLSEKVSYRKKGNYRSPILYVQGKKWGVVSECELALDPALFPKACTTAVAVINADSEKAYRALQAGIAAGEIDKVSVQLFSEQAQLESDITPANIKSCIEFLDSLSAHLYADSSFIHIQFQIGRQESIDRVYFITEAQLSNLWGTLMHP